ncbi:MAG: hypothetical protein PHQ52_03290, partial [Candidatus Omnitrophica bacterium]|nr:hypothetical protein [Candidatus Omnitrophota bacterium]
MIKQLKAKILSATAIYMTSNYIDVVKGSFTLNGPKITYLKRIPCSKNLSKIKASERKEEIDRVISKTFDEEDMPYRVSVNIENQDFLLRRFSMMNVPDAEIEEAMGFEVQKYIPYSLDKLSYKYEKRTISKEEVAIIFNACEKKVLNDLIKYFYDKDIIPSVIKPGPCLVSEGIRQQKNLKDGLFLSIHYQPPNKVVLTGIFQQAPCFFREIETILGEDEFSSTELVYPPLKDVWGLIEKDIVRVIDYLKKEFNCDIEKVFISGLIEDPSEKRIFEDFNLKFERLDFSKYSVVAGKHPDRFFPVLTLLEQSFSPVKMNLAP